jgi:hypothetical protein
MTRVLITQCLQRESANPSAGTIRCPACCTLVTAKRPAWSGLPADGRMARPIGWARGLAPDAIDLLTSATGHGAYNRQAG